MDTPQPTDTPHTTDTSQPTNVPRPSGYRYFDLVRNNVGGHLSKIFGTELVYPRQLEIQLPGDHKRACNYGCDYCQGKYLNKSLAPFEEKALNLIDILEGKIHHIIFGGTFTEPTLNPHLLTFLERTKKYGSTFGIHTNGSQLLKLEHEQKFLTRLCAIADSPEDYISISLDAGSAESYEKAKHAKPGTYDLVLDGLERLVHIRGTTAKPLVRTTYLADQNNSSAQEIQTAIERMQTIHVDSLRFSIPYHPYVPTKKGISQVLQYQHGFEAQHHEHMEKILAPYLSQPVHEKPTIFYVSPEHQDAQKMSFHWCINGYYEITIGADGHVYRCSSTASPTFSMNRLGEIPTTLEEFDRIVKLNQDHKFFPSTCVDAGARCCRAALEINHRWDSIMIPGEF